MPMSDYLEEKIIKKVYRGEDFASPTEFWVGLFNTSPQDDGGGTELVGNGYVRKQFYPSIPVADDWTISNNADITWPIATGNWASINHIGIFDGETGNAGDSLVVHSVRLWHKDRQSVEIKPRLTIEHTLGTSITDFPNSGAEWLFGIKVFSPALIIAFDDGDAEAIRFESHFGSIGYQRWDDWEIDVDVVDV